MSSSCWLNCGSSKPTDPCWQNTGLNSLKKINRKWEIEFCEEGVLVSIDERGNIGYQIRRKKLRSSARVQIQHGQQHHHRLLCWLLHPLWRQGEVEDMELGHREGSRMDVEEPLERRTVSWMWHGAQEKHCGDQDLWGIHHRQPSEAWLESSSLYYLGAHAKIYNPRSWSQQYIYSGYSCPLLHRNSRWGDSSMSSLDFSLCPGPRASLNWCCLTDFRC